MPPSGIPDFLTRRRQLRAGACELQGRAWSGTSQVDRVEVGVDGGSTWDDADLTPPPGPYAWVGWRWTWDVEPGEHEVCCRATDADGQTQPLEHRWNMGGYAVNTVHRVPVTVDP